jgi:hypothetical protein
MSETFDPSKHILVVRDRDTGRHVHVEFAEVVQKIAAAPAPVAKPVDLTDVYLRIAQLEANAPQPIEGLSRAVSDGAASLAQIAARLTKLEHAYQSHSHDYNLTDQQLQIIASAVLEQLRLAGVKAA